jgi:hypothetical protein
VLLRHLCVVRSAAQYVVHVQVIVAVDASAGNTYMPPANAACAVRRNMRISKPGSASRARITLAAGRIG